MDQEFELDPLLLSILTEELAVKATSVRRQFAVIPPENYTDKQDIKVLVTTFNANGRRPVASVDFAAMLPEAHKCDLVVMSFQEIVPLNASSVMFGSGIEAIAIWDDLIAAYLNNPGPSSSTDSAEDSLKDEQQSPLFVQVAGKQLVGMYITIWASSSLVPSIRGVEVLAVGTGVLGFVGNKGAVGVRLRVNDSGLCFINSHLSSGENVGDDARRNFDYAEIIRRGNFSPADQLPETITTQIKPGGGLTKLDPLFKIKGHWGFEANVLATEHVFWMGDLNYRLAGSDPLAVHQALKQGNLQEILDRDELGSAMRQGLAFECDWVEAPITFPPTFKLKRGTDRYLGDPSLSASSSASNLNNLNAVGAAPPDIAPEQQHPATATAAVGSLASGPAQEKVRAPAWTDRILYRTASPNAITCERYTSVQNILISDHWPVSATFSVKTRIYDRTKVVAAVDVARRVADAQEMAAVPHIAAKPTTIDIGAVRYGERLTPHFTISVLSSVPVEWSFIQIPGSASIAPPWVVPVPVEGHIPPGESVNVVLNVAVHGGMAQELVAGQGCALDAILVVHGHEGNDVFVSVAGSFIPSCFGLSFSTLATMARPIRPLSAALLDIDQQQQETTQAEEQNLGLLEEKDTNDVYYPRPSSLTANSPNTQLNSIASREDEKTAGAGDVELLKTIGIPPELLRLTSFLSQPPHLSSPGLFTHAAMDVTAAVHPEGGRTADTVTVIREALDAGVPFPEGTNGLAVVLTLLAWFKSLPEPLIPRSVEQAYAASDVDVSPSHCWCLLQQALDGPEFAVLQHTTGLFAQALQPPHAAHNNLTLTALAALLAELWFAELPEGFGVRCTGDVSKLSLDELNAVAEGFTAAEGRRVEFIGKLLLTAAE